MNDDDIDVYVDMRPPSRASIATPAVVAVACWGLGAWVAVGGSEFDGRHLVGFLAMLALASSYAARAVSRAVDRHMIRTGFELD